MVTSTQISPMDVTGVAKAKAEKKIAKDAADLAKAKAIVAAAEAEDLANNVHDPKNPDAPVVLDEIETVDIDPRDETVVIRVIQDIDAMTYGVGNTYTFKANVKYKVPVSLANYLESLGYIWRP